MPPACPVECHVPRYIRAALNDPLFPVFPRRPRRRGKTEKRNRFLRRRSCSRERNHPSGKPVALKRENYFETVSQGRPESQNRVKALSLRHGGQASGSNPVRNSRSDLRLHINRQGVPDQRNPATAWIAKQCRLNTATTWIRRIDKMTRSASQPGAGKEVPLSATQPAMKATPNRRRVQDAHPPGPSIAISFSPMPDFVNIPH